MHAGCRRNEVLLLSRLAASPLASRSIRTQIVTPTTAHIRAHKTPWSVPNQCNTSDPNNSPSSPRVCFFGSDILHRLIDPSWVPIDPRPIPSPSTVPTPACLDCRTVHAFIVPSCHQSINAITPPSAAAPTARRRRRRPHGSVDRNHVCGGRSTRAMSRQAHTHPNPPIVRHHSTINHPPLLPHITTHRPRQRAPILDLLHAVVRGRREVVAPEDSLLELRLDGPVPFVWGDWVGLGGR